MESSASAMLNKFREDESSDEDDFLGASPAERPISELSWRLFLIGSLTVSSPFPPTEGSLPLKIGRQMLPHTAQQEDTLSSGSGLLAHSLPLCCGLFW